MQQYQHVFAKIHENANPKVLWKPYRRSPYTDWMEREKYLTQLADKGRLLIQFTSLSKPYPDCSVFYVPMYFVFFCAIEASNSLLQNFLSESKQHYQEAGTQETGANT